MRVAPARAAGNASGGAGGKTETGGSKGGSVGSGGSGGSLGWAVRMANSVMARNPNPDTIASSSFSWEVGYTMWSLEKVWRANPRSQVPHLHQEVCRPTCQRGRKCFGIQRREFGQFPTWLRHPVSLTSKPRPSSTAQPPIPCAKPLLTYPRNSDGGFWHSTDKPNQMWVDGVFMGEMFLAR